MDTTIPRLDIDDLPPDLANALRPRVARLGYLGEFFRCAAHQPEALHAFMDFTEALKRALPDSITELVALTVAVSMGNAYERNQHERLCRKLGFGDEWIRAVSRLQPQHADALAPAECAIQTLVLAVIRRQGHDVTAELDAVVGDSGPATAIAILLLIGRYSTHSLMVNALGLAPPVPSIFAPGPR